MGKQTRTTSAVKIVVVLVVLMVAALAVSACGGDSTDSNAASWCSQVKQIQGDSRDIGSISDKEFNSFLGPVLKSAPAAIRDDLRIIVEENRNEEQLLELPSSDSAQYASLNSSVDTDKVQRADKAVDSYTKQHCHMSFFLSDS